MTTVAEAIDDCRLSDALTLQRDAACDAPGVVLLAELLLVSGRPGEARRTIDGIAGADDLRALCRSATRRGRVRRNRLVVPEPTHLRHRVWAFRHAADDPRRAVAHLDRADRDTPELAGHVDGREFTAVRDADDRFASVLEFCSRGRYYMVPLEAVRAVELRPARLLVDRAFGPATLTLADGRVVSGHVPLIYPDSDVAGDEFQLGEASDLWSPGGRLTFGVGARVVHFDNDEVALKAVRRIDFRAGTRWGR